MVAPEKEALLSFRVAGPVEKFNVEIGSCEGRNCSSCGSCCSNDMDYSNVKVITEKAILEFDK